MTDQDTIKAAYADTLKNLFSTFLDAYIISSQQADKDSAGQKFQNGVAVAREVRDKALALV